ncbi:TIGR02147 family protein [Bdellovibrio sp. ZAP7]|uniref:TIGR02147 family protein n=1 Tax=Bdellovibrio sp. ZAP7 TaxID=2231053 RepID=UPI00143DD30B|nr:TIGR02147 family protein [Bdellovibrio sp. ZAP7]
MKTGSLKSQTYRDFIFEEFKKRKTKNSSYSMRAFARDLDLNASRLSEIMNGKVGLSDLKGAEMAGRFGLSGKDREYFLDLIRAEHSRSSIAKKEARERVRMYLLDERTLTDSEVHAVVDWRNLALLELLAVPEIETSASSFAKRLGLPVSEVEEVVAQLVASKMLDTTGERWQALEGDFTTSADVSSHAIQNFHHQMLKRADRAIQNDAVEEREFSSVIFAMSAEQMKYAKDRLREFRRALVRDLEAIPGKEKVFSLSMQLFELKGDAE